MTTVKNPQAVAIAKDVLEWLGVQYIATPGRYAAGFRFTEPMVLDKNEDLQTIIKKVSECQVCALGACMLSKARLFNNLPLGKLMHDNYRGEKVLSDNGDIATITTASIFGKLQTELIESAFECCRMAGRFIADDTYEYDLFTAAVAFGERFPLEDEECDIDPDMAEARMRAIMQNIIDNGGEFMP